MRDCRSGEMKVRVVILGRVWSFVMLFEMRDICEGRLMFRMLVLLGIDM